jgi:hypothetical protein
VSSSVPHFPEQPKEQQLHVPKMQWQPYPASSKSQPSPATGQGTPQPPQFGLHIVQAPALHASPAEHTLAHVPQLFGSLDESTQVREQHEPPGQVVPSG